MLLRKEAIVCLVLSLGTNSAFESKILIFCRGGISALLFNTYNIYSNNVRIYRLSSCQTHWKNTGSLLLLVYQRSGVLCQHAYDVLKTVAMDLRKRNFRSRCTYYCSLHQTALQSRFSYESSMTVMSVIWKAENQVLSNKPDQEH